VGFGEPERLGLPPADARGEQRLGGVHHHAARPQPRQVDVRHGEGESEVVRRDLERSRHRRACRPSRSRSRSPSIVALYGEDLGRAQFEQEYLCSFNAAILGAFYAREMLAVRSQGASASRAGPEGKPVHTAWDIGVRDDTTIWWFQVVGGSC
jgi:hypothetical protein